MLNAARSPLDACPAPAVRLDQPTEAAAPIAPFALTSGAFALAGSAAKRCEMRAERPRSPDSRSGIARPWRRERLPCLPPWRVAVPWAVPSCSSSWQLQLAEEQVEAEEEVDEEKDEEVEHDESYPRSRSSSEALVRAWKSEKDERRRRPLIGPAGGESASRSCDSLVPALPAPPLSGRLQPLAPLPPPLVALLKNAAAPEVGVVGFFSADPAPAPAPMLFARRRWSNAPPSLRCRWCPCLCACPRPCACG